MQTATISCDKLSHFLFDSLLLIYIKHHPFIPFNVLPYSILFYTFLSYLIFVPLIFVYPILWRSLSFFLTIHYLVHSFISSLLLLIITPYLPPYLFLTQIIPSLMSSLKYIFLFLKFMCTVSMSFSLFLIG